jgi:hypothetical protein
LRNDGLSRARRRNGLGNEREVAGVMDPHCELRYGCVSNPSATYDLIKISFC